VSLCVGIVHSGLGSLLSERETLQTLSFSYTPMFRTTLYHSLYDIVERDCNVSFNP